MATCILYRPLSIFHLRPTCCTVDRMDCHRKLFLLLKKAAYRHRRESFLLLHHRSIESIHHQHIFEYQRSS
jgi:hypothetical protein